MRCLTVTGGGGGGSGVLVCVWNTPALASGERAARRCDVSPAATRLALGASSPGQPHCCAFTDQLRVQQKTRLAGTWLTTQPLLGGRVGCRARHRMEMPLLLHRNCYTFFDFQWKDSNSLHFSFPVSFTVYQWKWTPYQYKEFLSFFFR